MNTLINMKNNLIQNFYIIGLHPEDFFHINEENEGEFLNIFQDKISINLKEKIISKFPPNNSNFNEINDEIIVNHCFPNGFSLIKEKGEKFKEYTFHFELDNLSINYSSEEKNIYSKMYFTCLRILEPLKNYLFLKEKIITKLGQKVKLKDKNIEMNQKFANIYVPKILCFASIYPSFEELTKLLIIIYKNYFENNNSFILEKMIEQIVLKIPIPLNHESQIQLSFDSNKIKEKVIFPLYNMKEENLKFSFTGALTPIFYYFTIEDTVNILKYILLEVPILFFCENRRYLSLVIEGFLSLISPFKYVHPYITVLPKNLFGLISSEKKFIFGINDNYEKDFFKNNDIEIDKNIIVVYADHTNGKIDIIKKENFENDNNMLIVNLEDNLNKNSINNKNIIEDDYVIYNGIKTDLINIELPPHARKSLRDDLFIFFKNKNNMKERKEILKFNYKIKVFFYKFMIKMLSGYTDYYLNSKYFNESFTSKNCGFELLFKENLENNINHTNFIREILNIDEFINKSDNPQFYFVFFQTKIFLNFLRERIYLNDKSNSMRYRQFDQICFLKKHKDYRRKKENKGIFESFESLEKYEPNQGKIMDIKIVKNDFNEIEKEQINKKDKIEILIKYAQNITQEKGKTVFNYFIFPKLLFDDEFFECKYENLFLLHNIEMPRSRIVDDYKKLCSNYSVDNYKQRRYIYPPASIEGLPITNNSKANFEVTSYYYIFYDWIILLCCSLWYCEPIERIIRLDEVLIILDKLYYIEDIVIKLCFNTFIKYGNKNQCIKAYEKIVKFYGYSSYYYLNLLNNKLSEKEDNTYNEYINDKEYIFKDRSMILNLESFIQKRVSKPDNNELSFRHTMFNLSSNNKISIIKHKEKQENNYKERILFSSEQFCKKCKCYNSFDFEEIKKQKLSKINYKYKCIKCKTFKDEVYIKYQLLLYNKKRDELYITKMGEFKLLPPNRLYKELMFNLTSEKNWEINVDNIMNEVQINLMNYLFYFSIEELSFDFLLPFKKITEEKIELIQNNLCSVICDINKRRFSLVGKVESNAINKDLLKNKENANFVPIDISNSDNFDKYFDLVPCYIDKDEEDYISDWKNQKCVNIDNNKSLNYFTINGTK